LLKRAGVVIVSLLAIAGIIKSRERHAVWRNTDVFAAQSAADSPNSWRAQGTLADMLSRQGDYDKAVEHYLLAISLASSEQAWQARNRLAELYLRSGKPGLALEQLRQSLYETPTQQQTVDYLIQSYLALEDYHHAYEWADRALQFGGNPEVFGKLRAEADSALRRRAAQDTSDNRLHR
jgi:tetratricopeptide (TPR) repeat protein